LEKKEGGEEKERRGRTFDSQSKAFSRLSVSSRARVERGLVIGSGLAETAEREKKAIRSVLYLLLIVSMTERRREHFPSCIDGGGGVLLWE